jgi:hypothetical protein
MSKKRGLQNEQIFYNEITRLINNFFVKDRKKGFNRLSVFDLEERNKEHGIFILEKIESMKHLINLGDNFITTEQELERAREALKELTEIKITNDRTAYYHDLMQWGLGKEFDDALNTWVDSDAPEKPNPKDYGLE